MGSCEWSRWNIIESSLGRVTFLVYSPFGRIRNTMTTFFCVFSPFAFILFWFFFFFWVIKLWLTFPWYTWTQRIIFHLLLIQQSKCGWQTNRDIWTNWITKKKVSCYFRKWCIQFIFWLTLLDKWYIIFISYSYFFYPFNYSIRKN